MAERPAAIWKDLPVETRARVAEAFWRDEESPDIQMQQVEAALAIARRMNFRPKSVAGLSIERRAKVLAQIRDVSDAIATRALISYHFADQRPLMGAFLDALGIAHENGLIQAEQVDPPPADRIRKAIAAVQETFPPADVTLYVRTLAALDGDTWANVEPEILPTP
ncbi:MAG: hypothetical protein R2752_05010 [Vicinamibacterales bacterium]